jgi:hypothetical protein
MTHDNHTRSVVRALENRRERETRNSESGLVSVVCVSIGALHDDGGRGTVSARLALQQTRNFSAGDHSTLQEVWDARLKHTRMSHLRSSSMRTTHALMSFRKSGDPKPGTSWTRVCGWCSLVLTGHGVAPAGTAPIRVGQCVNPNKGRADRPMTPPTHAASSMCFAPASEVLDPPPDTSGGDVKGLHTAGLPRPKNQRARRAEERPRTRAAPAATQGGRGTSQAARSKHPHPSSGCCRWSAAAAP